MFTCGIVENDAHPPGLISTAKERPESLCWLIAAETKVKVDPAGSRHVACEALLRSKPRHDAQPLSLQSRSVAGNGELSAVKAESLSPLVAFRVAPPGVAVSLFVNIPRCELGWASTCPRGIDGGKLMPLEVGGWTVDVPLTRMKVGASCLGREIACAKVASARRTKT